ncbi:MAG: PilZ domain-containing protein [Candidatus Acidiferrales bacterium]
MSEAWLNQTEGDQRRYPRTDWSEEAILQCSGREYILAARNISEGGMGAESCTELPASALGFVSFQLKAEGLPLACRCRVIYSVHGKGVGIEFLDVSEEARWMLKSFINKTN